MPYLTNNFLFHVPGHYFPSCKVVQPVFAQIEYSYQRERFIEVLNVTISIKIIGKLSHGDNLQQEIQEAARQHHEKNFANPDDLAGVLTGIPQRKSKH